MPEALSEGVMSLSNLSWHMSWLLYADQNSSTFDAFPFMVKNGVDFYDSGFLLLALFCMAVSWKSLLWVTLGVSDLHEICWEPLELVLQNEWVSCCEHGGQYADVSLHDNLCLCMVHSQVLLFGCVGDDSFSSRCYWMTCLKVSSEEVMWYYSKMVIDVTWKVVNRSKDAGVTRDCKAIHSALGWGYVATYQHYTSSATHFCFTLFDACFIVIVALLHHFWSI